MKNEDLDRKNSTKIIKTDSTKREWIIIGGQKKWIRKCPGCNKLLYYSTIHTKSHADFKISRCQKCKIVSEFSKEKIRKSLLGRPVSEKTREKIRKSNLGKIQTEETKLKLSKYIETQG